jgi:hypothetical protein
MKKAAKKGMSKSPTMKKMHEKKESVGMKMKEMRRGGKS